MLNIIQSQRDNCARLIGRSRPIAQRPAVHRSTGHTLRISCLAPVFFSDVGVGAKCEITVLMMIMIIFSLR